MKSLFWLYIMYLIFKRVIKKVQPAQQEKPIKQKPDESYELKQFEPVEWTQEAAAEVDATPIMAVDQGEPPAKEDVLNDLTPMAGGVGKTGGNDTFSLDRQALKQGIIWAEILGPPRAKTPIFSGTILSKKE